jgi:hypothetical protein
MKHFRTNLFLIEVWLLPLEMPFYVLSFEIIENITAKIILFFLTPTKQNKNNYGCPFAQIYFLYLYCRALSLTFSQLVVKH